MNGRRAGEGSCRSGSRIVQRRGEQREDGHVLLSGMIKNSVGNLCVQPDVPMYLFSFECKLVVSQDR